MAVVGPATNQELSCERRVLAALRRIVHAIDIHSRQLVSQCEVTAPQLVCLHMLAERGRMTSRGLAGHVHVTPSTLVGILDRLESKGLVVRCRGAEDRREVYVELTPSGRAFVAKAPSPLQSALLDKLGRLSGQRQRELAESLEAIVALMQADTLEDVSVLTSRFAKNN
jgi:DNA-binding MarR family transcriptional regulator